MYRMLKTDSSWTLFICRLTLGIVLFPHGAQKLLGWFGGGGISGSMAFLTNVMGVPSAVAALVIFIESFGALGLISGLLSRASALGSGAVMLGAMLTVHLHNGFFANWAGNQAGEGYEYHLLTLGLALPVLLFGGGRFSLDGLLAQRLAPAKGASSSGGQEKLAA